MFTRPPHLCSHIRFRTMRRACCVVAVTALVLTLVGNDTRVMHAAAVPVPQRWTLSSMGLRNKSRAGFGCWATRKALPCAGLSLPHCRTPFASLWARPRPSTSITNCLAVAVRWHRRSTCLLASPCTTQLPTTSRLNVGWFGVCLVVFSVDNVAAAGVRGAPRKACPPGHNLVDSDHDGFPDV